MELLATPGRFRSRHPADRIFIPVLVALAWLSLLLGFVPDMFRHVASDDPAYPLVIHVHAAAFTAWMALLAAQTTLVQGHRLDVHRRLGRVGLVLAIAMCVLGPWAGIASETQHFGTPRSDPGFLAIMCVQMIGFAVQVSAAAALRADAAAHKRLMLLATLFLTTAGFARWLAEPLGTVFGESATGFFVSFFGGSLVLVLLLGLYDLATRGRLHPAYVTGAAIGIACEVASNVLYYDASFKAWATQLVAH
jgi:hypothetical protein